MVQAVYYRDGDGREPVNAFITVFRGLVEDTERTGEICRAVADALARGRRRVVPTHWTEHVEALGAQLTKLGDEPNRDERVRRRRLTRSAQVDIVLD